MIIPLRKRGRHLSKEGLQSIGGKAEAYPDITVSSRVFIIGLDFAILHARVAYTVPVA